MIIERACELFLGMVIGMIGGLALGLLVWAICG